MSQVDKARLIILHNCIKRSVPGFEVKSKSSSFWQKVIAVILYPFNRSYMKGYISTFYPLVYWPDVKEFWDEGMYSFKVLAHEYVHLRDDKAHRGWFGFSYLLPQLCALLALGALLAIWFSNWFLMFLCALVFLLPLPAYWRYKWEFRGYAINLAIRYWLNGSIDKETKDWTIRAFVGPNYYFMFPFKKFLQRKIAETEKRIKNGDILFDSPVYVEVKDIINKPDDECIRLANEIQGGK